jgi:hypothetical protein
MAIMTCPGCGKRRRTKPGTPVVCQCYVPGTKQFKARMKSANQVRVEHGLDPVPEVRYRLIQDEDCHWYVIRVGQEQEFDAWQDAMVDCLPWKGHDFSEDALGGDPGRVTFPSFEVT